jgi:ABC-type transport system involved in multi-copper enzyme maturation permease subunit
MRRRWMPWVLLLTIVAAPFAFYLLVYFSANAQLQAIDRGTIPADPRAGSRAAIEETLRILRPDRIEVFGMGIVNALGPILLIVLAASQLGSEFGWGTLRTLLAHGAGRGGFLAAKVVSLLLFAVVFALVGVASLIGASYLTSAIAGFSTTPGVDLEALASAISRGFFAWTPYLSLAMVLAVFARAAGAGIAGGLILYFAESIVAIILVQLNRDFVTIVNYGISRNVQSITRVLSVPARAGTAPPADPLMALPDMGPAAVVLLVYTVAFLLLAWWRLRSRDVTLGS